uniref:Cadherin domain-containing protein n=1 Tax=Anabas testudineus TaxID=64144 RepID=A0A3Q1I9R4_ANATE
NKENRTSVCLINLKSVLENPLEIHYVAVEVLDVNDHSPSFPENNKRLELSESTLPGTRFQLHAALDPDGGVNSIQQYKLNANNNFRLEVKDRGKDGKVPILQLQSPLDREASSSHKLLLTAMDGGKPPKSGTMEIFIDVLDVNDNVPVFTKDTYSAEVNENAPVGTTVIRVNATDMDEGLNGEVSYSFGNVNSQVRELFDVNSNTGEIIVKGQLDYEVDDSFEIVIQASDSTTVALISITDLDSGVNGKVISFVEGDVPFTLTPSIQDNMYAVVTKTQIDREKQSIYEVTVIAKDNNPPGASIFSLNAKITSFLNINSENGDIVALKSFDFETVKTFQFQVVATDSGSPSLSSNVTVNVFILDQNDNAPVILYPVSSNGSAEGVEEIPRNVNAGHLVTKVRAYDADIGYNGWLLFSLQELTDHSLFGLDRYTGQIRTLRSFTETDEAQHKLVILVKDNGNVSLCRVIIKVKDVNDNPPEIEVTSLSNTVSEDSKPGTVISLLSLTDKDSGANGKIISQITDEVPFELKPSYKENIYSVVTKAFLDREEVSHYEIRIKATDCGEPPLSTFKTLNIQISDVNDNSPQFNQNPLQFYLVENNVAGASIFAVSATDKDVNENAAVSYHIGRAGGENDVTAFLNINSENGQISALKSFDFETVKTFQFQVVASDSGSPSLSSNVTVNVFILDQNDNAPVILYPVSSNGSAEGVEEIPRNVNAGHLVTKVRAYDADIGYNGWLLFSLQELTDHSLFGLDRYTGQIRTLRSFTETDEAQHKLVILVKDNGNVSLSATATVLVKVVEPKEAFAASDVKSSAKHDEDNDVTFYLMITLGSVSVLFLISIIVLIAMQCSKSTDYTSKYLQEPNYDGTLCHSIQYRSGDKRYMLVGPRMSIGSTIVPGSHANTLVMPDRRTSTEVRIEYVACVG